MCAVWEETRCRGDSSRWDGVCDTVQGGLSEKTEYCETGGAREMAKESRVRDDLEQRESKTGRVSLFSLLYPGRAPFSRAPTCRALTPPDTRQGCLLPVS